MMPRRVLLSAVLALAALPQTPVRARELPAPACFSAADNRRLPFAVIQQTPPATPRARQWAYYPLTGLVTMQLARLGDTPAGIDGYFLHWANRSTAPVADATGRMTARKPNLQPSALGLRHQRTAFTSIGLADACTLAQGAALLGARADAPVRSDLVLVHEADVPDRGETGAPDTCVLPDAPIPATAGGIMLDYEVADGHTPQQTRDLLLAYARMVHRAGRSALLLLDPFNAPSQALTGIGAGNAAAIVNAFDLTGLMLWSGNAEHDIRASYRAQRALIAAGGTADPNRLVINFELNGTSIEDALAVHDIVLTDHLHGVMFWRNRGRQGGDCSTPVNRKIAAVVFGSPDAPRSDPTRKVF